MQINIWPAVGQTVYSESGVQIPSTGINVTTSYYYSRLLRNGSVLTYDPLNQGAPTPTETVTSSETSPLYCTELASLVGSFDRAVIDVDGYSASLDGGGGQFVWLQGSSTTADNGTVFGTTSHGRWKRIYTGRAVNVRWFGADSTGATSSTTAIQNALNTGLDVEIPPGTYLCVGLTQSTNSQRITCAGGVANLTKSANGVILTSTGNNVTLENILFRGDASTPTYTGDNATFSGASVTLRHCGSRWSYGRAVLATGGSFTIDGTCDVYQRYDAGNTLYDIEVGISGTTTLYHVITRIRTSQSTGGIKLVETGGAVISDSQFGKLYCDTGATGAGSGAPRVVGNRIIGAAVINQSNGLFTTNLLGGNWTFGAGTASNYFALNGMANGTTILNSGNENNFILREISTGSYFDVKLGEDSSLCMTRHDPTSGSQFFPGYVRIPNNRALKTLLSDNVTEANLAYVDASDNCTLGANGGSGKYTAVSAGTGGVYAVVDGTSVHRTVAGSLAPQADAVTELGLSSQRWERVYAVDYAVGGGTITWSAGSGSPEGVVTAVVGSLYSRTNGGAGTSLYVKESGSGNTGWVGK